MEEFPKNGQWLLENNRFGHITGHNDSVDFDSERRPNAIAVIRNNVFAGGGDDALDMTGDAWIEGNTFRNFIKDEFNVDPGESNTISSSDGEFWMIRNVFENVQHASLVKEEAFAHFLNNTVISSAFAPLYFDLPGQTSGPGRGAIVANSIFANAPATFDQIQADTDLTVSHSYLTDDARQFEGNGNLFGNPSIDANGYLAAGSFAAGAGSDGQDMGARIGSGATITGAPMGTTSSNNATIQIGGAAITDYRYRIDGGSFSQDRHVDTPIVLTNLSNGTHVLEVIGINELGTSQDIEHATTSTWTVDSSFQPPIVISEVLASNQSIEFGGVVSDLVELHNPSSQSIDLSGYSLTDDLSQPDRFVIPQNTTLGAGQYLTFAAATIAGDSNALGFSLNADGDGVYLF